METQFTRWLRVRNGTYSVTSSKPGPALETVVRLARDCGHTPPRWWQFWLPRWPKDAVAEFARSAALSSPEEG